jgi:hypothetical protein
MLKTWTMQVGKLQARKDESLSWEAWVRVQEEP